MPGRLFLTRGVADVAAQVGVEAPAPEPPRRNIQPGQDVLTLTSGGFQHMRWGMIPSGRKNARGRPVMETIINARSETVFDKTAFDDMRRAVVPADGWYEWTGKTRRKTVWDIRSNDGMPLWFAAIYDIWHGPGGIELPQVATLTCPPPMRMSARFMIVWGSCCHSVTSPSGSRATNMPPAVCSCLGQTDA